jgi:hypothetical protein
MRDHSPPAALQDDILREFFSSLLAQSLAEAVQDRYNLSVSKVLHDPIDSCRATRYTPTVSFSAGSSLNPAGF